MSTESRCIRDDGRGGETSHGGCQTGLLPVECSSLMRSLYRSRLQSDYGDTSPTTKADATLAIANAEQGVTMLRGLLAS